MQTHAKAAPEGGVAARGQYNESRIVAAAIVSDYQDTHICPLYPKKEKVRLLWRRGKARDLAKSVGGRAGSLLRWWYLAVGTNISFSHPKVLRQDPVCVCVCVCVCVLSLIHI